MIILPTIFASYNWNSHSPNDSPSYNSIPQNMHAYITKKFIIKLIYKPFIPYVKSLKLFLNIKSIKYMDTLNLILYGFNVYRIKDALTRNFEREIVFFFILYI